MVTVTLRQVDEANWEDVVDLELTESQEPFVASNAYSLAEAAYDKHCTPLAIYADDKVVGFIMYACMAEDGKPDDYIICRFMVDKRHQNQGCGRQGLDQAIKRISSLPNSKKILICYKPDNAVARNFYASFGFVEVGLDDEGEMIAEMPTVT